jgi:hypothetical protein
MLHNTAQNINLATLTFWSNNWGVLYLLLENETQTISKINNVIDYLIQNKLRVGAVSQDVMLNYPPKFSEEEFPNIGKLKFICN